MLRKSEREKEGALQIYLICYSTCGIKKRNKYMQKKRDEANLNEWNQIQMSTQKHPILMLNIIHYWSFVIFIEYKCIISCWMCIFRFSFLSNSFCCSSPFMNLLGFIIILNIIFIFFDFEIPGTGILCPLSSL